MAKKITAPKTYDPGKGRPKEHLAYLNEKEMAYLRSINGNNMERGPRGLPSFPPEDAVGSSSRSSGNVSGVGGGGGGGGGSTGSRGSSSTSVGSRSGSEAPGNRGAGGQAAPTTGGGYKGPSSPMGGQGTSFSNDTSFRQQAQVRDAVAAVQNSPAFRNDASAGGIRSLNVGPIGTPVNIASKIPTNTSISQPARVPRVYESPLVPGMTPEDMARRGAIMQQMEDLIRQENSDFPDQKISDNFNYSDVYGPNLPEKETILSVEDVPPEVTQKQAMASAFNSIPGSMFSKVKGTGSIYSPDDDFYQSARIPSWKQSMPSAPPTAQPPAQPTANEMTTEQMIEALRPSGKTRSIAEKPDLSRESWRETPYGEPGNIERKKDLIDKYGKHIPGVLGLASRVKTGLHNAVWGNMSADERIAQINDWNRRDNDRIRGLNGNENDRGEENRDVVGEKTPPKPLSKPSNKAKSGGPRPQKYYYWDVGVNIPSPTDSDYTLYMNYLREKAAAKAAV